MLIIGREIYFLMDVKQIFTIMHILTFFGTFALSLTSQKCIVSPFLGEYPGKMNIPISSVGNAYTLKIIEAVILVFVQFLCFGNCTYPLLINPNQ